MFPGGFGAIIWDSEEYLGYRQQPYPPTDELYFGFVPFDCCGPAVKGLVGGQIEGLLEQLTAYIKQVQQ